MYFHTAKRGRLMKKCETRLPLIEVGLRLFRYKGTFCDFLHSLTYSPMPVGFLTYLATAFDFSALSIIFLKSPRIFFKNDEKGFIPSFASLGFAAK